MTTKTTVDGDSPAFGWNIEFAVPDAVRGSLEDGFNRYGVREHDDGSIDVLFAAMEPGVRHGVEVTEQFLTRVASKPYAGRLPFQYDHSHSQRENVGWIEPQHIKYSDGFLRVMAHVPNTGSQIRTDTIADFTHDPPAITDGSVGLNPRSVEVDPPSESGEPPVFTDAELFEFSLTPFPAGYDEGGLTAAFSEAIGEAVTPAWGESRLVARTITDSI